ncbi:hypothetical protein G7046_g6733 [Stylonectria norvegica]|nr:hypothetical protein G7046_g6733 [Stylonectria norvegica]
MCRLPVPCCGRYLSALLLVSSAVQSPDEQFVLESPDHSPVLSPMVQDLEVPDNTAAWGSKIKRAPCLALHLLHGILSNRSRCAGPLTPRSRSSHPRYEIPGSGTAKGRQLCRSASSSHLLKPTRVPVQHDLSLWANERSKQSSRYIRLAWVWELAGLHSTTTLPTTLPKTLYLAAVSEMGSPHAFVQLCRVSHRHPITSMDDA